MVLDIAIEVVLLTFLDVKILLGLIVRSVYGILGLFDGFLTL